MEWKVDLTKTHNITYEVLKQQTFFFTKTKTPFIDPVGVVFYSFPDQHFLYSSNSFVEKIKSFLLQHLNRLGFCKLHACPTSDMPHKFAFCENW